jgi:2-oxo-3-hexenedioate decarboxylase/2-keto-4-pentenoate hydratase
VHRSGASVATDAYGRAGLEFEIAVRLGRDLRPDGRKLALADVTAAVDAVCPAIEIVDDRHADYSALEALSLIADNSWNAGIVLGAFAGPWPDLESIEGVVSIDGKVIDRGFGRDVLGHPFHSVAWLATHLAEMGTGLRAGDIVMTGNLVTTKFPDRSSAYRFAVAGLGAVDLSVRVR